MFIYIFLHDVLISLISQNERFNDTNQVSSLHRSSEYHYLLQISGMCIELCSLYVCVFLCLLLFVLDYSLYNRHLYLVLTHAIHAQLHLSSSYIMYLYLVCYPPILDQYTLHLLWTETSVIDLLACWTHAHTFICMYVSIYVCMDISIAFVVSSRLFSV